MTTYTIYLSGGNEYPELQAPADAYIKEQEQSIETIQEGLFGTLQASDADIIDQESLIYGVEEGLLDGTNSKKED